MRFEPGQRLSTGMKKWQKWALFLVASPLLLIFVAWLLLLYEDEFFVYKTGSCSWVSLTKGMRFEADMDFNPQVTNADRLVFRHSPRGRNEYIFSALQKTAEENEKAIYSVPKYHLFLDGPRVTIASAEEWEQGDPIRPAQTFDGMRQDGVALTKTDPEFETELEEHVTGTRLYEATEVVSPNGRLVVLTSHTPWYRSIPFWYNENHGMIFWEIFDLASKKRLVSVAAVFLAMDASDVFGSRPIWLPGGVLVISPAGERKKLLICKTN
jgi:hypothetical protein